MVYNSVLFSMQLVVDVILWLARLHGGRMKWDKYMVSIDFMNTNSHSCYLFYSECSYIFIKNEHGIVFEV